MTSAAAMLPVRLTTQSSEDVEASSVTLARGRSSTPVGKADHCGSPVPAPAEQRGFESVGDAVSDRRERPFGSRAAGFLQECHVGRPPIKLGPRPLSAGQVPTDQTDHTHGLYRAQVVRDAGRAARTTLRPDWELSSSVAGGFNSGLIRSCPRAFAAVGSMNPRAGRMAPVSGRTMALRVGSG
jgi:hypothetical protein